jgi:hypothetical protein
MNGSLTELLTDQLLDLGLPTAFSDAISAVEAEQCMLFLCAVARAYLFASLLIVLCVLLVS